MSDLNEIRDDTLKNHVNVFLSVVKENGLPFPVIDITEDEQTVIAMWDKRNEALNFFFDKNGIMAIWCSIADSPPICETTEYDINENYDEVLAYLKRKLVEMSF